MFYKNANPSLNDDILSNSTYHCMNVMNFNCGLSDEHMISIQFRSDVESRKHATKNYRCFKNFSEENFFNGLNNADFNSLNSESNVDLTYNHFELVFTEIMDKHASMKSRKTIARPALFYK